MMGGTPETKYEEEIESPWQMFIYQKDAKNYSGSAWKIDVYLKLPFDQIASFSHN